MSLEFWIATTDFVGKILIAVVTLLVHHKVRTEKKIDREVFKNMRLEQGIGLFSLTLFVVSYVLTFYR